MVDSVALGSLFVSGVAVLIAVLTWLESRKLRKLFEKVAKALPFVTTRRRKSGAKESGATPAMLSAAEERRRLKLELDREKHEWRKNRDIAKTLGWIAERMSATEDDED
jgi:hypothetical protein